MERGLALWVLVSISNRIVRVGLTEKMIFKARLERSGS